MISEEKGQCYRVLGPGTGPSSCSLPILKNITKQICCCSHVGKAWGADCQHCPYFASGRTLHLIPYSTLTLNPYSTLTLTSNPYSTLTLNSYSTLTLTSNPYSTLTLTPNPYSTLTLTPPLP